jgi:hypothetical protein
MHMGPTTRTEASCVAGAGDHGTGLASPAGPHNTSVRMQSCRRRRTGRKSACIPPHTNSNRSDRSCGCRPLTNNYPYTAGVSGVCVAPAAQIGQHLFFKLLRCRPTDAACPVVIPCGRRVSGIRLHWDSKCSRSLEMLPHIAL